MVHLASRKMPHSKTQSATVAVTTTARSRVASLILVTMAVDPVTQSDVTWSTILRISIMARKVAIAATMVKIKVDYNSARETGEIPHGR